MWDTVYHTFWSEWFWLPNNITWADVTSNDVHKFPERMWLLGPPIFCAIVLIPVRILIERYVWAPIGRHYGLRNTKRRPEHNVTLEKFARENKSVTRPTARQVAALSKSTGWREIRIERWFAIKRALAKPGQLTKFNETCWRLLCYSFLFAYGATVMSRKWWTYDADQFVIGWPEKHYLDDDIKCYFMMELGFYISLAATVMFDVKRQDFVAMSLHHITTVSLLSYAWLVNATRIGALIMVLFDPADVLLEMAKLVNYMKTLPHSKRIADILFVAFAVVWFITRVAMYASAILYRTLWKGLKWVKVYPGYFCFNGMLVIIYILQLYWSILVWQAVWRALTQSDIGDTRSDDEFEEEEDDALSAESEKSAVKSSNGSSRHTERSDEQRKVSIENSRNGFATANLDADAAIQPNENENGGVLRKRM